MSWELSRRREESKRSNKQKTCRLPHRRRAYGSKSTCDPVTQRPAIRLPTNKNSRSRGESDLKCQRCSCKEDDVEKESKQRRGKSATKSMCSRKLRVALRVGMFSECIRTTQPKRKTSACPFVRFGRPISCELGRIAEYVSFSKYLIHVKKLKPYLQYSYIVYRNMRYLMTSSRYNMSCYIVIH